MDPDIQAGHQVKALILEAVNSWRNYKKRCLQGAVQVNTTIVSFKEMCRCTLQYPSRAGERTIVSFKCWRINARASAFFKKKKKLIRVDSRTPG